jgi:hypothetical protein
MLFAADKEDQMLHLAHSLERMALSKSHTAAL